MNLARLALNFSCSHTDIHTTLVSASKMEFMKMNVDVVVNGLTPQERDVSNEIRER